MIQRDGNNASLWQTSNNEHQSLHYATDGARYDVIIAGGGITGITTGLQLQKAGKSCLVLEAGNLAFGTTGGTTAHLNTLLDTPYSTITRNFSTDDSRLVAAAARSAINLVESNVKEYNIDCGFISTDAFMYSADEKEDKQLDSLVESALEAGVTVEFSDKVPGSFQFIRAIRIPDQAKFEPVRYLHGIARAFEAAGGVIMQHCRVEDVKDGEPVEVKTAAGTFLATDLIYATHIPPGINLIHLRCAPWRSYAMAVKLSDGAYPDSLIYDMKDPYFYYRSQEIDGQLYLIAGGEDHKTGNVENTENCFTRLEAQVRRFYNVSEVTNRWSSQYFEPTDGLPYIGHLPGHSSHVFTATGYSGNGMIYSAISAMVFTSMLTGVESPYVKLFSPSRIKPIAGFTNFVSHNADVVKNFASRILPSEKMAELADLATGEGKIVTFNRENLGIYKDETGTVHAVVPTCSHMKCGVKWNSAELSWDCPCHGARYSYEGKVITGPASHDLERINIEELVSK